MGIRSCVRLCAWWIALGAVAGCAISEVSPVEVTVRGDAIPVALSKAPADPARGLKIMSGRDANCLLCHAVPESGLRFMGNLAPPLSGVGGRLSAAQLRLRVVDMSRLNPETIMPPYYRVTGLRNVADAYRGRPVLTAQEIEDVVAYLQTLK